MSEGLEEGAMNEQQFPESDPVLWKKMMETNVVFPASVGDVVWITLPPSYVKFDHQEGELPRCEELN